MPDRAGERACPAERATGLMEKNCLMAAVSRSRRAPMCLVASDSWPQTFAFGLANAEEEVELSGAHWWHPTGWAGSAVPNSAAGNTALWS
jgi:hypothetical protein